MQISSFHRTWAKFQKLESQFDLLRAATSDPEEHLKMLKTIQVTQIGNTTIFRSATIGKENNIPELYFKYEGDNLTGTHKDRIAFSHCLDALARGFSKITLATCGNYGVAASIAAKLAGLKCTAFVPEGYNIGRICEMEQFGTEVIRQGKDYETSVALSSSYAKRNNLYDANPGGNNSLFQMRAYEQVATEIHLALHSPVAMVAAPVSNGTLLSGIYRGFCHLREHNAIPAMPVMVAGSSLNGNPIVESFLLKKSNCEDLDPNAVLETPVSQALINWHSPDGTTCLNSILKSGGWAAPIADNELVALAQKMMSDEGIAVQPASVAGLAALLSKKGDIEFPNAPIVVILTGQ